MKRIGWLDGLRGCAAMWVLVGHCMMLTGYMFPIISQPSLGVDLFILISGYLMVDQYQIRREREDWGKLSTWAAFWLRRFFRIAPLYYVTLAVALALGSRIYADRVLIDGFLGHDLQARERYTDGSTLNIALHGTFLFGLFPAYTFRTPLPDWSIGLEMQFYAVFPLIVWGARRVGWLVMLAGVAVAAVVTALAAKQAGMYFPMPAFLPLKFHLFACGMLAAAKGSGAGRLTLRFALALALAALPIGGANDAKAIIVREGLVSLFFALAHLPSAARFASLLSSRPFYRLGELSYGGYLIHLLLLQPVAARVIQTYGHSLTAIERFSLVLPLVAVPTYALAFVARAGIERSGQALGRLAISLIIRDRHKARSVPAEAISAP